MQLNTSEEEKTNTAVNIHWTVMGQDRNNGKSRHKNPTDMEVEPI